MRDLILGRRYGNKKTLQDYVLFLADISDEDDFYHRVELYKGTIEQLQRNNFREIWAGSVQEFREQWELLPLQSRSTNPTRSKS